MPIYEYRCEECGRIIEFFQKGFEPDEAITCPNCGSEKLQKLLSAPAAVIMGDSHPKGTTCCGRTERCDSPPCSTNGICKRD
jgi:putative FmdB family regulatory protein